MGRGAGTSAVITEAGDGVGTCRGGRMMPGGWPAGGMHCLHGAGGWRGAAWACSMGMGMQPCTQCMNGAAGIKRHAGAS